MEKTCDLDKLYERKHPRDCLPIEECKQCLFNILCNDYIIHEESWPASRKTVSGSPIQQW